jgi:hypothetical protein
MITMAKATKSKQATTPAAIAMGRIIDGSSALEPRFSLLKSVYDVFVEDGGRDTIVDGTGCDVIIDVGGVVMIGAVGRGSRGSGICKIFLNWSE